MFIARGIDSTPTRTHTTAEQAVDALLNEDSDEDDEVRGKVHPNAIKAQCGPPSYYLGQCRSRCHLRMCASVLSPGHRASRSVLRQERSSIEVLLTALPSGRCSTSVSDRSVGGTIGRSSSAIAAIDFQALRISCFALRCLDYCCSGVARFPLFGLQRPCAVCHCDCPPKAINSVGS